MAFPCCTVWSVFSGVNTRIESLHFKLADSITMSSGSCGPGCPALLQLKVIMATASAVKSEVNLKYFILFVVKKSVGISFVATDTQK